MDFELTEEQAALREVSRGMLAVNCPPGLVRSLAGSGHDIDDKLWRRGAELGWIGLAVPEEHDGAGQGLVELCLVAEEIGRAAAPGAFTDSALIALALARHGHPELAAALAAGGLKAGLACHGAVTVLARRGRPGARRTCHRGPGGRRGRLAASESSERPGSPPGAGGAGQNRGRAPADAR